MINTVIQAGRSFSRSNTLQNWPKHYTVIGLTAIAMCICYIDRVNISVVAIEMQREFGWDDATKGIVLSSFFAGYLVMQLLGGILANKYGGRLILGLAVLIWSLFTILTPVAAYASLSILLLTRVLMGLGEGSAFPAGYNLVAHWSPAQEQTRAIGLMMSGAAFGTVIALLSTGWIINRYGWPSVFYLFGATGVIWAILWFKLVPKDSGSDSAAEQSQSQKPPLPWRQLFSQRAIWAIIIASATAGWTFYIFVGWLPSYFNDVYNLSLLESGVYAAVPWLVLFLMQNGSSWIASRLMDAGISRTTTRKWMQCVAQLGTAALIIALIYVRSPNVALIVMSLVFATMAFTTPGYAANIIDVAPQFADVLSGVITSIASIAGLIAVTLTGLIIQWTNSYEAIFWVTAVLSALSASIWIFWCSGEEIIQKIND